MSTLLLALVGFGSPAVAVLVGRVVTADDTARAMRRHQEALAALGELTRAR